MALLNIDVDVYDYGSMAVDAIWDGVDDDRSYKRRTTMLDYMIKLKFLAFVSICLIYSTFVC